jgi:hypothetical protein
MGGLPRNIHPFMHVAARPFLSVQPTQSVGRHFCAINWAENQSRASLLALSSGYSESRGGFGKGAKRSSDAVELILVAHVRPIVLDRPRASLMDQIGMFMRWSRR